MHTVRRAVAAALIALTAVAGVAPTPAGAGTVAADDPQLTTRHVSGPSPLRVVLDPTRRLEEHYRVFSDDAAATLYVVARSASTPGEANSAIFVRAST